MRDYGTAQWEGGDKGCDHSVQRWEGEKQTQGAQSGHAAKADRLDRRMCLCGARRIDSQLGLEADPQTYIANMVAVFREVWRVLRDDGTLWLNLGDCYAGSGIANLDVSTSANLSRHGDKNCNPKMNGQAKGRAPTPVGLKPKDLCMMPARIALALQADGWYLRSDIIWAKPNPMPESVTDRPTKAHEYIFLLTKQERYFYDADAIREPVQYDPRNELWGKTASTGFHDHGNDLTQGMMQKKPNGFVSMSNPNGRNKRSVWTIAEPEHVAKCPIDPAVVAALQADGWEIRVEPKPETVDRPTRSHEYIFLLTKSAKYFYDAEAIKQQAVRTGEDSFGGLSRAGKSSSTEKISGRNHHGDAFFVGDTVNRRTVWTIATQPYAGAHFATFPEEIPKLCILAGSKPGDTILDPFAGSGTVGKVAIELGRRAILIELNPAYIELATDRTFVTPGFL